MVGIGKRYKRGIIIKYEIVEIIKLAIVLVTFLNILICGLLELRYIEILYPLIFFGLNFYVMVYKGFVEIEVNDNLTYTMKKQIVNFRKILPLGAIILACFYIFKEPYFFLSKNKILFLVISLVVEFLVIISQRIKIKLSLNIFKELIKIFIISGIVYYLPLIILEILFYFF